MEYFRKRHATERLIATPEATCFALVSGGFLDIWDGLITQI
jgi:hypothetical protein